MNSSLKNSAPVTETTFQQDRDNVFNSLSDVTNIKPFVSLKLFSANNIASSNTTALTTASGMAIITYVISGEATYADSTGKRGVLKKDDWSWVISGSGIGHSIAPTTSDYASIQLCIALSPALENSPPQSAYLNHALDEPDEPAQVLIGWHGKQRSEFASPSQVNYLVVHLRAQQQWHYDLPLNHQFAWVALISGRIATGEGPNLPHGVTVFNRPIGKMDFYASTDSILLVGSALEFDYDLVFQNNSVHTATDTMQVGLKGISALKI